MNWYRFLYKILFISLVAVVPVHAALTGTDHPVINVWYGDYQRFGHLGNPQQWVNILGNVEDPDAFISLTFSLNGGSEQTLSLGPDSRRLWSPGDFNIEIDYLDLREGTNEVVITATDSLEQIVVKTVTVDYAADMIWPLPYSMSWSTGAAMQDAVQFVDGLWTASTTGIRTEVPGYDRILAIGDISWTDYEVTVPITVHAIDTSGFEFPSISPGFGIQLRWRGHTFSNGSQGSQPRWGWEPFGATAWYAWNDKHNLSDVSLFLDGDDGQVFDETGRILDFDVTYMYKMRVETLADGRSRYSFKLWPTTEAEPEDWDLVHHENGDSSDGKSGAIFTRSQYWRRPYHALEDVQEIRGGVAHHVRPEFAPQQNRKTSVKLQSADLASGSLLFIAHHVDATFGDVMVSPVTDTIAPVIRDVELLPGKSEVTINWQTNEPAGSSLRYGFGESYELGSVDNSTLLINHSVTLIGLVSDTTYHCRIFVVDGSGNSGESENLTFRTLAMADSSIIVSDDFNAAALDTTIWDFVNPLGDASISLNGWQASISAPPEAFHDVWGTPNSPFVNTLPRITQPANDVNFEIEVKFDSGLSDRFQQQGVLVSQNDTNLIRLEFLGDGRATNLFIATFKDGIATVKAQQNIGRPGIAPLFMRVKRQGNIWTLLYSRDGIAWSAAANFNHQLVVGSVSVYAGNEQGTQHTAVIDYFRNTDSYQPDTTKPIIRDVVVHAEPHEVTITWQTDEPTTGSLAYGVTDSCELGNHYSESLQVEHTVTVTGLEAATQYYCRISAIDENGNNTVDNTLTFSTADNPTDIGDTISGLPGNFKLYRNFPNPFNRSTRIRFDVPATRATADEIQLVIYNSVGQVVITLFRGRLAPGTHELTWEGQAEKGVPASSGLYFVALRSKDFFRQSG